MLTKLTNFLRRLVGLTPRYSFKSPLITDTVADHYAIQYTQPQGTMTFLTLSPKPSEFGEDVDNLPFGWAMLEISEDRKQCFLWLIFTHELCRREGHAKAMIEVLQSRFEVIRTHTRRGIMSNAGTKLCLSCGFQLKRATRKKHPDTLIWRKE